MAALERVLHVEDDESIRTVTKVVLETVGGIEVLSCPGGKEALEKIDGFDPQVILLDVMMPEIDGPATLKQLKEKHELDGIMVIFMTAKVQQQELESYRSLGAFDVIFKPFDPMTLPEQLTACWNNFNAEEDR